MMTVEVTQYCRDEHKTHCTQCDYYVPFLHVISQISLVVIHFYQISTEFSLPQAVTILISG